MTAFAAALVLATALALRAAVASQARSKTLGRVRPVDGSRAAKGRPGLEIRHRRRSEDDVAEVARAMARALRGGDSPAQALAVAADSRTVSPALRRAAQRAFSSGLTSACEEWRMADRRRGVRLLTAALETGAAAGGPLARALDGVADTIESGASVIREARAQAATARASAAVLVAAPIAFAGFTVAGDASTLAFLTGTPIGIGCLLVAVALDVAGATWMAKITSAALR